MFIQTEQTPNPSALKFIPGPHLLDEPMDFPNKETARISPLALRLFQVEGVEGVFIGTNFITVTKSDEIEWSMLKPSLLGSMMEHLLAHKPILQEVVDAAPPSNPSTTEDSDVVKEIKEILDARVRPTVAQDGGDIIFDRFEDGVVYLKLQGACSSCPSSTMTLKSGIENMLRYYVPEVTEVRAV
ncbi:MAG: iron transporter [Alphaproteobacteria bacterium RIFCSPLOWO2_01_FULL_45_8]|nr:MAG: iron transporter [Alphaproteobacteria bacterium GWB1_45_5]OFW75908.1 MAG: iron transporter [Alphaproteobacteria bacterium GWA1_45_9]OFW90001.1 MAG: iron transporter [Alphaproteobacteria bacterium RIFCSPHIGHO2_01_FULL_41_14]OFW95961.1 MAG: iron transporter [Alphaproteobacteria bacterium RIFCSPLOWO2_01_FULL_45_8]HCI48807.1 NifU family protein [Holosporales bacterium]